MSAPMGSRLITWRIYHYVGAYFQHRNLRHQRRKWYVLDEAVVTRILVSTKKTGESAANKRSTTTYLRLRFGSCRYQILVTDWTPLTFVSLTSIRIHSHLLRLTELTLYFSTSYTYEYKRTPKCIKKTLKAIKEEGPGDSRQIEKQLRQLY